MDLIKKDDRWDLYNEDGHKIASTLDGCLNKLSLKNCQAIERGYDLDELAKKFRDETIMNSSFISDETSFKEGAKAILEILGDKKFSEEDMKRIYEKGYSSGRSELNSRESDKIKYDYIQSLQQTEWDVEIVEEEPLVAKSRQIHGEYVASKLIESAIFPKPKLDVDGCLILKRK